MALVATKFVPCSAPVFAFAASFAVACVLTLLALVTLVLKTLVEWRQRRAAAERALPGDTAERIGS